jgi:hypothetical protein
MVSFNNKYAIYIVEAEALKASKGKGVLLSRLQNVAVATPPVREKKKNKKPLCIGYSTFTRHKICCALSVN